MRAAGAIVGTAIGLDAALVQTGAVGIVAP
jgi:hypothetical protein